MWSLKFTEASCSSVDCSKNHFTECSFYMKDELRLEFHIHIGFLQELSFFLWDKVLAVA